MQSGSLGASVLRLADELGMGLSWFVSLGDKSDVSGNDLLQFWEDDEHDPGRSRCTPSRSATRASSPASPGGCRGAARSSPCAPARRRSAPTGGALYQQAGLIEVPTVAAMLDTARVLATQPVMRGPARRRAVQRRAARRCSPRRRSSPPASQPVDAPVAARLALDARRLRRRAARAALADDDVDAVLVVHAPPLADAVAAPVAAIEAAADGATKPVVAVLLGGGDGPLRRGLGRARRSPSPSPPPACSGGSHRTAVAGGRGRRPRSATSPTSTGRGARDVIAAALARGGDALDVAEVATVLGAYGIVAPDDPPWPGRRRRGAPTRSATRSR